MVSPVEGRCLLGKGFVTYQMNVWCRSELALFQETIAVDAVAVDRWPLAQRQLGALFRVLLKQCKSIEAQEVSRKEIFNTIMLLLHTILFFYMKIWKYNRYLFVACQSFVLSTIVPSLNFSLQRHCSLFSRFHYAGHQPLRVRSGAVTALGLEPPLS